MTLSKRKKYIIIASVSLLIAALFALIVFRIAKPDEKSREIFVYEDYEYVILENGRLEIVSYLGNADKINIPDVINGRSVYSIGEGAFRAKNISYVDVGSFTVNICAYAFAECSSLTEVVLSEDIKSISKYAFVIICIIITDTSGNKYYSITNNLSDYNKSSIKNELLHSRLSMTCYKNTNFIKYYTVLK